MQLPFEGKISPTLEQSTLMDLLAAQNKENILLTQSTIRQTINESTSLFREEISKQMAEVKSDLIGLIDVQKKDLDTFKSKFGDRLTNQHSMVKTNNKSSGLRLEKMEKKVNDLDLKRT